MSSTKRAWRAPRLRVSPRIFPMAWAPRSSGLPPPARAGARAGEAVRAVRRDAPKHRSPNAGWPEAAMAGALGLKLAGPRVYGETPVEDAFMGEGRRAASAADICRALRLYRVACVIQAIALAGAAAALL